VKRAIALSTTLVAFSLLCFARSTVAMARRRRASKELKHEINRWEDEGGSVAAPAHSRSGRRLGAM
jgi:hypothetical protein